VIKVVNRCQTPLFLLLFSTTAYVRDAGSQVQILPLRPEIIRFFVLISLLGQVNHRNKPALLTDRSRGALQMIGVMMPVGILQDFRRPKNLVIDANPL
jgi:hypothetical protein